MMAAVHQYLVGADHVFAGPKSHYGLFLGEEVGAFSKVADTLGSQVYLKGKVS